MLHLYVTNAKTMKFKLGFLIKSVLMTYNSVRNFKVVVDVS